MERFLVIIRREFLSKIGAVLATAATGATLAKAGDFKRPPQKKPVVTESQAKFHIVGINHGDRGGIVELRVDKNLRKIFYKVRFQDGHVEHRVAYERFGKYLIDHSDHRRPR